MALHKLTSTMIKIAGIFLAINMATLFGIFQGIMNSRDFSFGQIAAMCTLIIALMLPGFVMIFASDKIADWLVPHSKEGSEKSAQLNELTVVMETIEPIIFSLAGLYFLVVGGAECLALGFGWLTSVTFKTNLFIFPSQFLSAILRLIMGIYLVFGAAGLLKVWHWIRNSHPTVKR